LYSVQSIDVNKYVKRCIYLLHVYTTITHRRKLVRTRERERERERSV